MEPVAAIDPSTLSPRMTHTPHVDPVEFTASAPSLWTPRVRERRDPLRDDYLTSQGLDANATRILTGHQAGFWHCGILAKTLAAGALGARLRHAGGRGVELGHIVVDQDDNDAGLIEYPSRDDSGAIAVRQWRVAPHAEGVPTGLRNAVSDVVAPTDGATDGVNRGLQQMASAIRSRSNEPSLAQQMANAAHDVITDRCPGAGSWPVGSAMGISRSKAFAHVVERILANPRACVEAYNHAAIAFPTAGVRPLAIHDDESRIELPIWRITQDRLRVNARVADVRRAIEANNLPSLAPKALLMTAFLRVFACDLFVHGTGGGAYDQVMERWLTLWPASGPFATSPFIASNLAPAVVATATVRLPLLDAPVPSAAEVARARWLAHAARHNPALLNDADAAGAKDASIVTMPRADKATRLATYRALHARLDAYRAQHAQELAHLRANATRLAHLRAAAGPALRRTWAFPLATDQSLHELATLAHHHLK